MKYYLSVLKDYAKFSGRASRSEFWYFTLFNFLFSLLFGVIGEFMGQSSLSTGYSLATFIPSIAVLVRRMHDVDKSGWYSLIPIYNIILAVTAGDDSENNYGGKP
jgi:uncharacterized membrane protein YhaH (DUF805 family)